MLASLLALHALTVMSSTYQPSIPVQPSMPKSNRRRTVSPGLTPSERQVDERLAPRARHLTAVRAGEGRLAGERVRVARCSGLQRRVVRVEEERRARDEGVRAAVDRELDVPAVPAELRRDVVREAQPVAVHGAARELDRRALEPHHAGHVAGAAGALAVEVLSVGGRTRPVARQRRVGHPVRPRPAGEHALVRRRPAAEALVEVLLVERRRVLRARAGGRRVRVEQRREVALLRQSVRNSTAAIMSATSAQSAAEID